MGNLNNLIAEFISGKCGERCRSRERCKRKGKEIIDITLYREPWDMDKGTFYHPARLRRSSKDAWVKIIAEHYDSFIANDNFDELYDAIYKQSQSVYGIGELTSYDTALAIAIRESEKDLLPRSVYLHAGAAAGAKKLGVSGRKVSMDEFVSICPLFEELSPAMIEHFLCCCDSYL